MHGIVYVPESEAPTDPLESEGMLDRFSYTAEERVGSKEDIMLMMDLCGH